MLQIGLGLDIEWKPTCKKGCLVRDFKGFILNVLGCDIVGVIETPYLIPTEATKLESERKCGCVHVFSHSEMVPFK
ncbi:hypothetical protein OROGR_021273 [Orobanche gracilis]